ncbi:MAG: DUF4388 domain-containing protein [Nitrospirota bacterium]
MKNESTGFCLHEIVFLIGMSGRTGELLIESGNNIGTMLFHQGNVFQAFSPYSRAIGDLLVEEGTITDIDLMETLMMQKKEPHIPIGGLLLKQGKVTFEAIEEKVHEQLRQAVKEFQSWQNLKYGFMSKNVQPFDSIHLTVHEFIPPETFQFASHFFSQKPANE